MRPFADAATLYHLLFKRVSGTSHAERLENFYKGQASSYDAFRQRLLWGREALMEELNALLPNPLPKDAVWCDFGAGTGQNLEFLERGRDFSKIILLDLSKSLLEEGAKRADRLKLHNVETLYHDACASSLIEILPKCDLITFSYSLTMIPEWFKALDIASKVLKEGGFIGLVDFYVAKRYDNNGDNQSLITRRFWPAWFGCDNVELSQDHIPYLRYKFNERSLTVGRHPLPYLPFLRVPTYRFIGNVSISNSPE
jgi:S-adenosylmethionine-diacylgycerolhomoserine-N-methlytransferase